MGLLANNNGQLFLPRRLTMNYYSTVSSRMFYLPSSQC